VAGLGQPFTPQTTMSDERRLALLQKIREQGQVKAKGRKFTLTGCIWRGVEVEPHEWTVEFVRDPDVTGIVENAKQHHLQIIHSFESDQVFAEHRYNFYLDDHVVEFIGLHRCSENAVDVDSDEENVLSEPEQHRRQLWQQPCLDPVFALRHSRFENRIFDVEGVIVTEF